MAWRRLSPTRYAFGTVAIVATLLVAGGSCLDAVAAERAAGPPPVRAVSTDPHHRGAAAAAASAREGQAPAAVEARALSWGLYEPAFPGDPHALRALSLPDAPRGRYVQWYVHWGGAWSAPDLSFLRAVLAAHDIPVITWMSDDPSDPAHAGFTDSEIAAGSQDAYLARWATALRSSPGTVLLRFDHEMNGDWYSWDPGVASNTAYAYVEMWRHVHGVLRADGVRNVQWVWSPNVAYSGSVPLRSVYPGNGYVDWVGVDGYNWGTLDGHHWQSPAQVFAPTLRSLASLTSRPLMIAEVGCAPAGGSKSAWIAQLFRWLTATSRVRAVLWFDADKETDWRFSDTAADLRAFRTGLSEWTRH